jgi:hypothetical protein
MRPETLEASLLQATSPAYWQSLWSGPSAACEATDFELPETLQTKLVSKGYVSVPDVVPDLVLEEVISAARAVEAAGWLPTFAFLYDAPWRLARLPAVRKIVAELMGAGYRQLPDFWAYHVQNGERGYRPHREVSRDEMVGPDGLPRSITVWIALSDATLENGCIYVIPRDLEQQPLDPEEYGDDPTALIPYLLHRARALPVSAGSLLAWNHLILHWGSFSNPDTPNARRSISFEFIRGDVEPSLHPHSILPADLGPQFPLTLGLDEPLPSFAARLFLVARNIRHYYGRGPQDLYQQLATALLQSQLEAALAK